MDDGQIYFTGKIKRSGISKFWRGKIIKPIYFCNDEISNIITTVIKSVVFGKIIKPIVKVIA